MTTTRTRAMCRAFGSAVVLAAAFLAPLTVSAPSGASTPGAGGAAGAAVPATPTSRELTDLAARVPDAEPFRSVVGSGLSTWGVDASQHRVNIGVVRSTAAIRAAAATTFGPYAHVIEIGRIHGVNRSDDVAPFDGGGRIRSEDTECSSSWTIVTNAGNRYAVTAAHCFDNDAWVWMDDEDASTVGSVASRVFYDGGIDVELIGRNNFNSAIWGGSLARPVSKPVTGHNRTGRLGSAMCVDGAYTGEDCRTRLTQTDICANIAYDVDGRDSIQRSCHLDVAVSTAGRVIAVAGDSGGPVYRNDGHGGVTAYGIITAEASQGHTVFYTRLDPILAQYRSRLATR